MNVAGVRETDGSAFKLVPCAYSSSSPLGDVRFTFAAPSRYRKGLAVPVLALGLRNVCFRSFHLNIALKGGPKKGPFWILTLQDCYKAAASR